MILKILMKYYIYLEPDSLNHMIVNSLGNQYEEQFCHNQ